VEICAEVILALLWGKEYIYGENNPLKKIKITFLKKTNYKMISMERHLKIINESL
jgi:hypothetical protein